MPRRILGEIYILVKQLHFFFINMNNNYVFRFFLQTITLEMSLKNDFHIPFCTFAPLVGKDGRQSPRFIYTLLLQNDYRIKM